LLGQQGSITRVLLVMENEPGREHLHDGATGTLRKRFEGSAQVVQSVCRRGFRRRIAGLPGSKTAHEQQA